MIGPICLLRALMEILKSFLVQSHTQVARSEETQGLRRAAEDKFNIIASITYACIRKRIKPNAMRRECEDMRERVKSEGNRIEES